MHLHLVEPALTDLALKNNHILWSGLDWYHNSEGLFEVGLTTSLTPGDKGDFGPLIFAYRVTPQNDMQAVKQLTNQAIKLYFEMNFPEWFNCN